MLFEPADWAYTAYHCGNGESSAWMLLGLLPFIPSGGGKYAEAILRGAIKNSDSAFAVLGRYIPRSTKSYEKVAGFLDATHLFTEEFTGYVSKFGIDAWFDNINAPFIQREIIDKSKPVLLTIPWRVITGRLQDTILFREIRMLIKAGYTPSGSILYPPIP